MATPREGLGRGRRGAPAPANPSLSERCVHTRRKSGQIMNAARYIEPKDRIKAVEMAVAMGDWVHSLAPWQVISHLTFAWEASMWSAMRCYEKFMRTEMRGVSYFYALEENPGGDGYHAHACGATARTGGARKSGTNGFTVTVVPALNR